MFMLFVMNKLVRGDSCRMVFDHIQCVSLRTGIRGSAGSGEQSNTYKVYRTSAELERGLVLALRNGWRGEHGDEACFFHSRRGQLLFVECDRRRALPKTRG
jgi:hypothetical protein